MNHLETCFSSGSKSSGKQQQQHMQPRRLIPLEHIDTINASIKRLSRVQVTLTSEEQCRAFEIGGECPTQILAIKSKY